MKSAFYLAAMLACASVASTALAASAPTVVQEQVRTVPGGRSVEVLVAQSEIKSDINPSNLAVVTGGGLLGGLLAASQNASRAKKAEAAIAPMREALAGFDADALAIDSTKAALADIAWLQPAAVAFSKDSSLLGKSAMLDKSSSAQVAFIEYSYDAAPDFSSIRVVAHIEFANKSVPEASKPEQRLSPKHLAYGLNITSIVLLPNQDEDINANAARWAADGGKLERAALQLAFTDIRTLLPRTLALTPAEVAAMGGKDRKKGMVAGFGGRMQPTTGTDILLWGPGFIHAQPLPVS